MKKILFLIHALNPAGAQVVLKSLIENMLIESRNYEITVQTLFNKGEIINQLPSEVHYKSIIRVKNNFLEKICAYLIRRVLPPSITYKLFIKGDYDYEVAFLEGECTRLISASSSQSKKIAWVHINLMKHFTSQGLYKSIKEHRDVYDKFDNIICVSNGCREGFCERFPDIEKNKVKIINNIIHQPSIIRKSTLTNPERTSTELQFVCVGNMRQQKGYDRLLLVLSQLKNEGFKFHFWILGDGSEFKKIQNLLINYDLANYVKLLGSINNPYPYIAASDALVLSSYEEGYSTVAIESTLLGVPVITTDCCGMDEIFDNGKYAIVCPNTKEGIYNSLKNVLKNPKLLEEYKKIIPERWEYFSSNSIMSQIKTLLCK